MRRMIRPAAMVGCFLVLALCFTPCSGQAARNELLDQPIDLHLTNSTLLYALTTLAFKKNIPIGFEPSLTHKDEFNLNVAVDNARLEDVLNMIVEQEPEYRWEANDGVINFFPTRSRDKFVEKLLNTKIRRFAPAKRLDQFGIRDAIIDLPEVQELLKETGITAIHYGCFYHPRPYPDNLDLSISDRDVRAVMNKVVKVTEYKMWAVVRSGRKLESLNLGF